MNRLVVILNTYKSLGIIPDPDNFEAIVNILEELNFKKDETSAVPMDRKEIADWLIKFIKGKESLEAKRIPAIINVGLKLNNSVTSKLLKLRLGTKGNIRNFEDDFDDLSNS